MNEYLVCVIVWLKEGEKMSLPQIDKYLSKLTPEETKEVMARWSEKKKEGQRASKETKKIQTSIQSSVNSFLETEFVSDNGTMTLADKLAFSAITKAIATGNTKSVIDLMKISSGEVDKKEVSGTINVVLSGELKELAK